jgi:autotransporter-associated beta strand protein
MEIPKVPNPKSQKAAIHWVIALSALLPAIGSAADWISPTNANWGTPGNWSGGNIPDTNAEIANFNTPGLANPQIITDTTIQSLWVSASYTIGGNAGVFTIDANTTSSDISISVTNNATLTIDRDISTINTPQSITARVEATAGSTVTFAAGHTWTSTTGIAFQDITFADGGTFNFNGALVLGNNFLQAFNGFSPANGGTFNFNPTSVTAGAGAQIQNLGGKGRFNLMADFAQGKIVIGNNAYTPSSGPSETYLVTPGMTMSRNVEVNLANSFNPGTMTHQYGVDLPGAGTATQAGSITLGSGGLSGDNIKIALDVKTDDTMIVTGQITGGGSLRAGVIQVLAKTGPGLLRLEGSTANNWIGNFNIEQGAVLLNKTAAGTNAIGNVLTTVSASGELQLGKANQIADSGDLTLGGGKFNTGGFNETLDQFRMTQSSSIDFGAGASVLTFSQLMSGTGVLTIDGWTGSLAGGGTDQFRFTNTTGLGAILANIHFTGYPDGAQIVGNEVVPIAIPEPASTALLFGAGTLFWARLRRARKMA